MDIWQQLYVPEDITAALSKANFTDPTPIQSRVLPSAIRDCADILGAAPTGSGKTLAYGVPLLIRVRDLQLAERIGTDAAYSTDTSGSTDKFMTSSLPENPSEPIDTSFKKPRKRKKLSESEVSRNAYTNLALVEELDEETGAVRCVHSLLGNQYTEALDFKVYREAGATDRSPSSCRSHYHRVYGLVLLPTRELALQVCQHLRLLSEFMEPRPRIEAIVGGISIQKQNRLLSYHPEILVATPGRLWHFIQQEEPHVLTVRNANILVVDEADKLVEANHFEELRQLFSWLNEFLVDTQSAERAIASSQPSSRSPTKRRQTLVFSATLTFVHHGAVKPGLGAKHRKRSVSGRDTMTKSLKLAALRQLLGLNPRAKVCDLSTIAQLNGVVDASCMTAPLTPTGLQEMRLLCPDQPSKDVRLFWFLAFRRHLPAAGQPTTVSNQRSLIFVNSKTGVRRLAGVLRQLVTANAFSVSGKHFGTQRINVLHADMIQKQRLRALERFQSDPNGILLASDVAARGLDLGITMDSTDPAKSGVAWVIHFEVPHTAELYIHRSGRTARAHRTGNSVLFICPNEMPLWRRLASSLKRIGKPSLFFVDPSPCYMACRAKSTRSLNIKDNSTAICCNVGNVAEKVVPKCRDMLK
ncbi:ATP-dependent RNA helicase DDX24/MAK5 [Paragonimus westermani]|uniref:ATP-dependent RNA helicase n=1 Tax=Paragonimus westermani TaxID=34504 RepID=A0A5J4NHZ8_9TREM|nr:ATP-dependent RNA helicase DDX24/MAK5 [Paragonimus westermani]